MKKILSVLFFLSIFTLTGCEGVSKNARAIIGHTYGIVESSTSYMTIYFSKSGNAHVNFKSGGESITTSHFTYDIAGDDVEIYYDYSDFWKETAKGELWLHLTYYPEVDELHCLGDVMSRID
jgi:hypothetical protein